MEINSNHSNIAFDQEINSSRVWFERKIFDVSGYTSGVLIDALMQRFVGIFLSPYAFKVSSLCKEGKDCFPDTGMKINTRCASLEIGTGRVTVNVKQFFRHLIDFLLRWTFCLFAILSVKGTKKIKTPAVLVFGVGEGSIFIDSSDERFVNYCRLGPIDPLRSGKYLYIEAASRHVSSDHYNFEYCKRPLISLLRQSTIGVLGRFKLIVKHLKIFFEFVVAVIRLPQLSLLGKNFAYCGISSELDRQGLIESIVLTCSNFASQPIWLRELSKAKVHMVWYAQNWKQICYASDKLTSNRPGLRWIRSDVHWVWTHAFANYLSSLGLGSNFEVVGPIMWYMPEVNTPDPKAPQVVIFDNSPVGDETALIHAQFPNYYHPDNLFSFIKDIIALKEELKVFFPRPIKFCLKTKRGYNKEIHDPEYFNYIKKLDLEKNIFLIPHTTNIYSLISESHLVICFPFVSPAEIADTLSVPSIYYDPTGSIFREDIGGPESLMEFINNPNDLLSSAMLALNNTVLDK